MNSKLFPSTTQPLMNSSNKPPIYSHISFKFTTNHLHISNRTHNNMTTKASSAAAVTISAAENETLYDLLGISENVTFSEIKQAYKKLALKYHPDVSPPDRAEEYTVRFIKVQEAYETLSDPEARSMYDSCMGKGFAFSGKKETRFDPRSDDKKRWKETWTGQISELQQRRVDKARGMSWAARIRKQRNEACDVC